MLLFRTHQFDPATRAFCEKLRDESGLELVCLVDESRGPLDVGGRPKISVSRQALAELGLHSPKDFPWRCGDYGLYLAAKAYPHVARFWLVEYDVRIQSAGDLGAFFAALDHDDADLIAPMLGERQADWWWYPAMATDATPVYGCMFPILRVSARLVAAGLDERRRLGRSRVYRLFWPNDESFLVNTARRLGLTCRDFNADGRRLYTADTFSFDAPISVEALALSAPDGMIHHPVLFGADYQRKRRNVVERTPLRARVARKLRLMIRRWA